MRLAQVIGRVFNSSQYPTVTGKKLLLIQPLDWDTGAQDGSPIVAADSFGAGKGEKVFFVASREAAVVFTDFDGETAANPSELPPVDAAVTGIVDGYFVDKDVLNGAKK